MKYINQINEMENIPLIKELEPICKLDFWKKLSCFTVKNSECYTITDDVIFTILRSLALITNASCWMDEDLDGNYNYIYNKNEAMINFAKAFKVQEDGAIIENLVTLYKQFNIIIEEMNDLSSRDWKFFDECNLPHIISTLDYFNSLEREDMNDFLNAMISGEYTVPISTANSMMNSNINSSIGRDITKVPEYINNNITNNNAPVINQTFNVEGSMDEKTVNAVDERITKHLIEYTDYFGKSYSEAMMRIMSK